MSDELQALLPISKTVLVGGETIVIKPFKFRHIKRVAEHVAIFRSALSKSVKAPEVTLVPKDDVKLDPVPDSAFPPEQVPEPAPEEDSDTSLLEVVVDNIDAVLDLIQLATGKDKEWCDNLDTGEVMDLVGAIIEVNLDFFSHQFVPKVKALSERIVAGVRL
jgi:hypothetical protein